MKCPISKMSKSGRMKTGVDRLSAESRVKEKKSLAPHLKQTGRAYRFLGTAPQIGSVRNERNRFVGFVDINNHPIDAGIKNSYLFTARPHYIGAIRRIIVIRPDPIDHYPELLGLRFHRLRVLRGGRRSPQGHDAALFTIWRCHRRAPACAAAASHACARGRGPSRSSSR